MNPNSFFGSLRKKLGLSKDSPEKSSQDNFPPSNLSVSSEMVSQPQSSPQEVLTNQSTDSNQTDLKETQFSASTVVKTESPASSLKCLLLSEQSNPQEFKKSVESVSIKKEIKIEMVEQNVILQDEFEPKNIDENISEADNLEPTEPEPSTRAQLNPAVLSPDFISNIADSSYNELMSNIGFRRDQMYSGEQISAILNVLQMAIKCKVTESATLNKEKAKVEDNSMREEAEPEKFEFDFDQLKSELKMQSNKKT